MAGFSKEKVAQIIPIPILFEITGTDGDGEVIDEEVQVVHYFRRPTTAQRERFSDVLSPMGRKRRSAKSIVQATYKFWKSLIEKVEGYDDLPQDDQSGGWKDGYFKDHIGQEHVQASIILLMQRLGGVEGELLKKSVSSPEE